MMGSLCLTKLIIVKTGKKNKCENNIRREEVEVEVEVAPRQRKRK